MDDGNRSSKEAGGGEDVEGSKAVMETTSIENEVIPQKEGKVEKEVEKESNEVVVTVGRDAGVAAKGAEATDGEDVKDVSATEENKAGDGGRAEAELGVDGEVNRNVDGSAHREMETQGGDPGKDDIKPHEGGEDQGNVLEATGQQGVKNLQQAQVKTELSQSSPAEAVSLVGIPLVGSRPEIVPGKIQASLNQSQGQQIGQEGVILPQSTLFTFLH